MSAVGKVSRPVGGVAVFKSLTASIPTKDTSPNLQRAMNNKKTNIDRLRL